MLKLRQQHPCLPSKAGRTIGDIARPNLVGLINAQAPQKIRIDLMPRVGLRGLGARVYGLNAHQLHQALYPFAILQLSLIR